MALQFFRSPERAGGTRAPGSGTCGACRFFDNDPLLLEQASPGLAVLSSGFGAVRAHDGLCSVHARYVSIRSGCQGFAPVS